MNQITETVVTVLTLIIGVAILSVLVSRKSNTVGVIQAAASGFGNALGVATSPITGASVPISLGYGGGMSGFPTF
jgi:hypothetical protein